MQYYTQQTQNLVESTYNLYVNAHGKRRLPDDFSPGPYDVICARGKAAHNAEGNVRFRALVQEHAAQYGAAECKYEKSKIVSHIVNTVRTAAAYHQGGFVKQSGLLWFEVGDRAAKEKIGQTFRDLLHTKYSSSTKAKARVRIQRRMGDEDDEDHSEERSVEHVVTKAVVQVCFIILFVLYFFGTNLESCGGSKGFFFGIHSEFLKVHFGILSNFGSTRVEAWGFLYAQ